MFFADTLASTGEFVNAVNVLSELSDEGFGRESELALMYKRAAMAELIERRRDQALASTGQRRDPAMRAVLARGNAFVGELGCDQR